MTRLDPNPPTDQPSIRSGARGWPSTRVAVLYERGRSGSAALDLARALVRGDGSALTVVAIAPQDTRICCGAGSAMGYNQAVCDDATAELREARELLGPLGDRAQFELLVEGKDAPLSAWIAATDIDVVLLPARRRPLRSAKHPATNELRTLTSADIRVVDARSSPEQVGAW